MFFLKKQKKSSLPPRRFAATEDARQAYDASIDQRYNFRRNRTLTGSSSSHIASATEANAQLKSARVQTHELVKKRRQVGVMLLLAFVVTAGLYGLIDQFSARVVVRAPGIAASLDESYAQAIQDYYASRPVERLRFLTNQPALEHFIQARLPEVSSLRIGGKVGFGESDFLVTMRQPLAGWTIQNKQQYVDDTGTAFSRNYYPTPTVQIVDNSGIRPDNGQAVVASNRFLSFVGRTVSLTKQQGYAVTQVVIPAATTRQIELHIEGKGYPIKLSIDRKVGEQVEDMARALGWFDSRHQSPQYIDVRVAGKAFYR